MAILSPDDLKIKEYTDNLLKELPFFIRDYKMEKQKHGTSLRSIHQYLYRFKIFFEWLLKEGVIESPSPNPKPKDITLEQLGKLRKKDLEYFIEYLRNDNIARKNAKGETNGERQRSLKSVALTISALKSLYHFLTVTSDDDEGNTYLENNIMAKIEIPMIKETSANRAAAISSQILDSEQLFDFVDWLDDSENGYLSTLSVGQSIGLFKRDRERDIAMIAILLATGMRVGELARITLSDINYSTQQIKITRKGNKKDIVYVMDYAFEKLLNYIKIRNSRYPNAERCPFLFVSYRKPAKAISIRAIQYAVEKYTSSYFPNGVYPHKLRHSFSVAFVKNGGDLTILRDLLGHTDIKTTSLYVNMANSDKVDALNALNKYLTNR